MIWRSKGGRYRHVVLTEEGQAFLDRQHLILVLPWLGPNTLMVVPLVWITGHYSLPIVSALPSASTALLGTR